MIGMGPLEVMLVLLVAFIFVGPERMVEAGRFLGKLSRDLRRMTASFSAMSVDDVVSNIEKDSSDGNQPDVKEDKPYNDGLESELESDSPVSFNPLKQSPHNEDHPQSDQDESDGRT